MEKPVLENDKESDRRGVDTENENINGSDDWLSVLNLEIVDRTVRDIELYRVREKWIDLF